MSGSRTRGGPPRSEDADEYLVWRTAEEAAAAQGEPWAGRVDDVAQAMHVEPVTVTRWRRTVPSVRVWRAWLHQAYDRFDGMPELIERGDFDAMAAAASPPDRDQSDFLAEIVPQLASMLTAMRGQRATTTEIAGLLGVSRRHVDRFRTD